LRHNFRDCYDRVLQLKAYDADNRSRRARPRENTGASRDTRARARARDRCAIVMFIATIDISNYRPAAFPD